MATIKLWTFDAFPTLLALVASDGPVVCEVYSCTGISTVETPADAVSQARRPEVFLIHGKLGQVRFCARRSPLDFRDGLKARGPGRRTWLTARRTFESAIAHALAFDVECMPSAMNILLDGDADTARDWAAAHLRQGSGRVLGGILAAMDLHDIVDTLACNPWLYPALKDRWPQQRFDGYLVPRDPDAEHQEGGRFDYVTTLASEHLVDVVAYPDIVAANRHFRWRQARGG
ncbi:hypothetical protein [Tahibacter amnicola]|uniref:WbqC-like protein n=1 Tax=Tahibacter amnicola TaxID=2976241 RepID=A0ABY6BHY3_9GAMM|nr:hypothetical protein [Tahibacter amnicola]UXI69399.1 hypothetical protein N4264_07050 [Tahibacter amnicola]